jgi:glutathione S-transferase
VAGPLRVLGRINSINVRKVLWACDELGFAFIREDWGTGFRPTSEPEFQALNPKGLVPVLVDGDFTLTESNAILRYLGAKSGDNPVVWSLYPAEAKARARIEEWMDFQSSELNFAWRYAFTALVRKNPEFNDPNEIEASRHAWNRMMGIVAAQLERTGGHIAGEGFTLADIPIGLSVNRWLRMDMAKPALPTVEAYAARLAMRAPFLTYAGEGTD